MAGIGIKLNRIYEKNSLVTHVAGMFYSTLITVAPMVLVMINIVVMSYFLDYAHAGYGRRALFAGTVLYMFIFSMISASPYNSLISRYVSDTIYEEKYEDILPCVYTGLIFNTVTSALLGIPFCLHEWLVGKVEFIYVFMGFLGFMGLAMVLYFMLYMSICKDYTRITVFYFIGMIIAFIVAFVMVKLFRQEVTFSMISGLTVGFYVIAVLEFGLLKGYFVQNSRNYKAVLSYFGKYWKLIVANFAYTLGLYVHNFVFWTSDLRIIVVKSFYMCEPYDMATYIALLTNISSTVILITNLEMRFHDRYKDYSEAVIGGKLNDIVRAQNRMFRQLMSEVMGLVRTQFIITIVLFLACIVILPLVGFSGLIMQIYPVLAAAYFVIFLLYGSIVFLYYFNDLTGAVLVGGSFCILNLILSVYCKPFVPALFGLGCFIAACVSWTIGFFRLRWVEKNIDRHIFCTGNIMKRGNGTKPTQVVYKKGDGNVAEEEKRTGTAYIPFENNKDEAQKATEGEKRKSKPKDMVEIRESNDDDKAKANRAAREKNAALREQKQEEKRAEKLAKQQAKMESVNAKKNEEQARIQAIADSVMAQKTVEIANERAKKQAEEKKAAEERDRIAKAEANLAAVEVEIVAKKRADEEAKKSKEEIAQAKAQAKAEAAQARADAVQAKAEAKAEAKANAVQSKAQAKAEAARKKEELAAAKKHAKEVDKMFKKNKNSGAVEVASVLSLDGIVKDKPGVVKSANKQVEKAVEKHNDIVKKSPIDVMPAPKPKTAAEPVLPTVESIVNNDSYANEFKYDLSKEDDNYKYEEVGPITVKEVLDQNE